MASQSCIAALDFGATEDDTALAQAVHKAWEAVGILEADEDVDGDGYWIGWDNCPDAANPDQADATGDGIGDACCCVGIRGDVDSNSSSDIADLTYLVDFMFERGPTPVCTEEADIDGNGNTNIADLTFLVNHMFKSGPAPGQCYSN